MYGYQVHKDDTPCPSNDPDNHNTPAAICPLAGTGAHEMVDDHLKRVHELSPDEIQGIMRAAIALGRPEVEVLVRVHDAVHMFQRAFGDEA